MQSNDNPLHRRIITATEKDPLLLVKQLIDPAYLKQPENLEPFAEHAAKQINKKTGVQWTDSYDKNAAYVGAMATVKLGIGEPTHIQSSYSIDFSNGVLPGIWLIDYKEMQWRKPLDLVPQGLSWQYSPVVSYLLEYGLHYPGSFECRKGYYFEQGKRIMWKLYNYLKDWRERDKQAAKECYTKLFGILAHKPDTLYPGVVYRPDWIGTIVAESHVRIHRQAMQAYRETGIYPTSWKVDCLYYEQPVSWFDSRLGTKIGEWKHARREV